MSIAEGREVYNTSKAAKLTPFFAGSGNNVAVGWVDYSNPPFFIIFEVELSHPLLNIIIKLILLRTH